MRQQHQTIAPTFLELPINAGPARPAHTEIVSCVYHLLKTSIARYSKLLVLQFSLHKPVGGGECYEDNIAATRFLHAWREHLRRRGIWVSYVWVREQEPGGSLHWHVVACLNGHKTLHPDGHYETVQGIWARQLGCDWRPGLVRPVRYHILRRGDRQAFADAFYHASYVAKARSKGNAPAGVREFGSSVSLSRSR